MKRVLVTGARGFLGRHVTGFFKKQGYAVVGLGHGQWEDKSYVHYGMDQWLEGDAELHYLSRITERLDCIVHCAGGGAVGPSLQFPLVEFQKSVDSTINVLEYIRTRQPQARLIFPSSAAVYGEKGDRPIKETESLAPVSPYGYYKKITEELCQSYVRNFDLSVSVIRFFSIYGNGLKKQLLWDACRKLSTKEQKVLFFGSGRETRDWLHVDDAVGLIYCMSLVDERYTLVNGGGTRSTVLDILLKIKDILRSPAEIVMNGECKEGDPSHYWAETTKTQGFGWRPEKNLDQGLDEYVAWFQQEYTKQTGNRRL